MKSDPFIVGLLVGLSLVGGCNLGHSWSIKEKLDRIEHRIDSLTESNQRVDVLEVQMAELL